MKITPQNLINHELIGLKVEVSHHSNPSFIGFYGDVVYETKNMLFIRRDNGKIYKISKRDGKFVFTLPDNQLVEVHGRIINNRPEERLKIKIRRKW